MSEGIETVAELIEYFSEQDLSTINKEVLSDFFGMFLLNKNSGIRQAAVLGIMNLKLKEAQKHLINAYVEDPSSFNRNTIDRALNLLRSDETNGA